MKTPLPLSELRSLLARHGQEHVLAGWDQLGDAERWALVEQLTALDFELLKRLYAQREQSYAVPSADRIEPLPRILPDADDPEARQIGERALAAGEVAALVVAGGQGSRLGFDKPKGMFAIGPVSNKSLFQIHAEKVLARRRNHRAAIPFLVMTSDATHADTVAFFREHVQFGLPAADVFFFQQGTMPALDLATGRLIMEGPGRLFTGPNGHGGTLTALAGSGLLDELRGQGVRHIFYFQVDNPLVKIADPQFIGQHIGARSEVSSKVIPKDGPTDKLGNFVLIDDRLSMIEYSDLPAELARQTDDHGNLQISAGNPAIHIFDVDFLKRVTAGAASGLPFHLARKKVPCWDPEVRQFIDPPHVNALKFERFIFDVLPHADRWLAVATNRREEFAPLKNATGADSPESVKRAISDLAADWLRRAGAVVEPGAVVEISPLAAVEPAQVKIPPGTSVGSNNYFDEARSWRTNDRA